MDRKRSMSGKITVKLDDQKFLVVGLNNGLFSLQLKELVGYYTLGKGIQIKVYPKYKILVSIKAPTIKGVIDFLPTPKGWEDYTKTLKYTAYYHLDFMRKH